MTAHWSADDDWDIDADEIAIEEVAADSEPIAGVPGAGPQFERAGDTRVLRRVLGAFRPYGREVLLLFAAIASTTILGLLEPFLLRFVIDDAIGRRNSVLLVILVALMVALPFASGAIGVAESYLGNFVGQSVMGDYRRHLFGHLQRLSLRFFTETRAGEIQSRLTNDIAGVAEFVTYTGPSILVNILAISGAFVAMVIISPLLTLVSLAAVPVFLVAALRVGRVRRSTSDETQRSLAELLALSQETLSVSGMLLAKLHGQTRYSRERFDAESRRLTELEVRQAMIGRWTFMFMNALFAVIPALVYLVGGLQIIARPSGPSGVEITLGSMIAFTLLQAQLFYPLAALLQVHVDLQGALALFQRVYEYLDLPVEIGDAPDAVRIGRRQVRGWLTFDHVSFAYRRGAAAAGNGVHPASPEDGRAAQLVAFTAAPGGRGLPASVRTMSAGDLRRQIHDEPKRRRLPGRGALRDISFDIRPGELAALVGPSGAGKTTVTYLATRLYDVDAGQVAIDGTDVREIALDSLSSLIGVVTQETFLFHASVNENLRYARLDATDGDLIAAAEAAAIHDRIRELPEGYDTVVGERGFKLSGGEKQRLAIARLILKDPRILILDEATSALDTHSERLIQGALARLMEGRTTLAIAHRLSTILAADVILVMDRGEIVERGRHDELLAQGGVYAHLYREQFSVSVPAAAAR